MIVQELVYEACAKWIGDRPITFDEFLEMPYEKRFLELIDGAVVEKMAAQLDHEYLVVWLVSLFNGLAEERNLGAVLSSRATVKINDYRSRLPDVLFVRHDRLDIVEKKAIVGAPDLVIEIVSPGDRPSEILARETDYRGIGVQEIVLIDRPRRRVRTLRKGTDGYVEETLTAGAIRFETLQNLSLEADWLLGDTRPS